MFSLRDINLNKIGDVDMPDMVYYNFDIINGKTVDEGYDSQPTARFNETRDGAIIKDTSKYYFSIVRFSMDGPDKSIPMFIPRIQLNQPNINLTTYQIGFSLDVSFGFGSNSFFSEKFIEFEPQNSNAIPPQAIGETKDFTIPYYFVYNYDWVVYVVNKTFDEIFADLQTQYNAWRVSLGQPPAPLDTKAPFMKYEPSKERFDLYLDKSGFETDPTADEQLKLYFNSNMYGLFSNFPHKYLGGDLASRNTLNRDGYAYEIEPRIYKTLNIYNDGTTDFIIVEQDYKSTSSLWSPLSSIVFVSTLIPILNEQTGQPIKYGSGNTLVPVGTQSAFQPIITDIAIGMENAHGYNEFLSYVPTAEYRMSTLSNSPLEVRNIDVQVYWKSRLDGNLYPIELFNLSNISVKILFRKRVLDY